ncbi:cytochrome P450 [Aliidiomarina minuta]|uniref:Cytochrome P450 n=1 Tax=Aliidiomarina minuta TaxID=880057 RepID=A0A432W685_9GAMM|nr:cytochrome P450 [Aliidiomarina minuta]RUO25580.1 cytochrome P450 [Aliidiomarina minuta]
MYQNNEIPKEKAFDQSIQLIKEGYSFIANRRQELNSNIFESRLLGQKAYCLAGSEAARLFYDESKFKRAGVAPLPIEKTLFGEGGVQGLDDEAHKHRKALFMSLWTEDALSELRQLTQHHYAKASEKWQESKSIILYDEVKIVLTRVICEWTGVPLEEDEVEDRAEQLSEMYEKAGYVGLGHFKGWVARSRAEDWISELVEAIRNSELQVDEQRPIYKFCWHRDENGELLDVETVAVEILNLLRPTVANAVWITFAGLAVHDYPQEVEEVRNGGSQKLLYFCQEIRRFYPFFPFTVAQVRHHFEWNGCIFEEGTLTLLDLYGTNHHPDEWEDPEVFNPARFEKTEITPFNFIPQGGGGYESGHRCAGEWMTLTIVEESVDLLINQLDYKIPDQDLSYDLSDIPALPRSKVKMTDIRLR